MTRAKRIISKALIFTFTKMPICASAAIQWLSLDASASPFPVINTSSTPWWATYSKSVAPSATTGNPSMKSRPGSSVSTTPTS